MKLTFLTPAAGLVAFAAILPLAAFVLTERRAERVRSLLRLAAPGGSPRLNVAAISAVALLVGIAAAQPVIEDWDERPERVDAQVIFAIDTTRSMLSSRGPDQPTRFDRAVAAARGMRDALGAVPVGIVSLTDQALPLLFPTSNRASFEAVLRDSIAVDKPESNEANNRQATDLGATRYIASGNFFRGARHRVLVVFTDAQTKEYEVGRLTSAFAGTGIKVILVRLWAERELVYGPEGVESAYVPDPAGAAAAAERYATLVKGEAFDEGELDAAIQTARSALGSKGSITMVRTVDIQPLGPYVLLAALVPLAFLLVRRNLA
jgi:von Willebrand factor type A domain